MAKSSKTAFNKGLAAATDTGAIDFQIVIKMESIKKLKDSEKDIERKLREEVKLLGGLALKLNPDGMSGIPDRLILMPGGDVYFAELKTTGKRPRKLQEIQIRRLKAMRFPVYVIDSIDSLKQFIDEIC